MDFAMAQRWLLCFGQALQNLQEAFVALAIWLESDHVPWASIPALMIFRLIALDKIPGIRLVSIGDIWHLLLAKCLLWVTGDEAEIVCGADQLCSGMRAGIEDGIHAMCMQWDADGELENQGFLLVDAKNAFNSQNQLMMLWAV